MWGKFRNSKLCSTALTLGATSLASLVALGPAKAGPVDCSPVPSGGSSLSSPTVIPSTCTLTEIFAGGTAPEYWEFSWDQVPDPVNISASGSFFGSSTLYGSLDLYTASDDNLVASAEFGSFSGIPTGVGTASLGDLVLAPEDYIIGILPAPGEDGTSTSITIDFAPAAPEPASLGLFAGALAALGLTRRRRKPLA